MTIRSYSRLMICALGAALCSCGDTARLTLADGSGPHPVLPSPHSTLIPTVHVAPAVGWGAGDTPQGAPGIEVTAYARTLDHPRWLYVLPNGDVLVAETNAPPQPEDGKGIRAWAMRLLRKKAGAGPPSPDRITLLRDAAGSGTATQRSVFLDGLHSPFGMALVGSDFYVADSDAVLKFPYKSGDSRITAAGVKLLDLPAGEINHHWTKNLIASRDGTKLYVTVGSNSNAGENGMAVEAGRAAIWEVDVHTGAHRVLASGLRNPNGLAWEPDSSILWAVVNERDELGSDLVPDYLTSVVDGAFYGWPYSYYGEHIDERVKPPRPDLVASARVPDYALGPHTASLGLAWSGGSSLPGFASGMFVGEHGSWNRKPFSGYRVVFVPFQNGVPTGASPQDVLTGFITPDGKAKGRPVGVALDKQGALLVADDVGNVVWRLSRQP